MLFRSTTGIVLRWKNAIVQYRNGPLEGEVFNVAMEVAASNDGGPLALLGVLGPEAVTPDLISRLNQRRVLKEMLERVNGYSAVVLQERLRSAEGLPLSSRLVTHASGRMRFMPTGSAAASWLDECSKRGHAIEALWNHIVADESIRGLS